MNTDILIICAVLLFLSDKFGKAIQGIYNASTVGHILFPFSKWVEEARWIPQWVKKPLITCPYCMPSFWVGLLLLLPFVVYVGIFHFTTLPVAILTYILTIGATSHSAGRAVKEMQLLDLEVQELTDVIEVQEVGDEVDLLNV
ncbi:MAG: hypothetical protein AAF378_10670 [Cyanobacteria bacterium P01_A01_bin.84]